MPKFTKSVSPADDLTEIVAAPSSDPSQTSYTDWRIFEKCGLVPVTLDCQAYKPIHGADMSCHTHLKFNAATIRRHIESEHGGGFQVYLKRTEGKPSPLWKELSEAGLEAYDFRCDICDQTLRFHPTSILPHMKPHRGKLAKNQDYPIMKAAQPKAEGKLNFTILLKAKELVNEDEGE